MVKKSDIVKNKMHRYDKFQRKFIILKVGIEYDNILNETLQPKYNPWYSSYYMYGYGIWLVVKNSFGSNTCKEYNDILHIRHVTIMCNMNYDDALKASSYS